MVGFRSLIPVRDRMFLLLSKTLDLLLAPLTWAIGLWLLALVLWRRERVAPVLAAAGLVLIVSFSLEPVAGVLLRSAEASVRRTFVPGASYDAVIVLGGIVDPAASRRSGELELTERSERILRALELLRSGQARAVLLSGGLMSSNPGEPSEAEQLAVFLRHEGIAPGRIVIESHSRNTRENAVESARIVSERGWHRLLLITSAWHMPRAVGCFRAVGLTPDVLPVDHLATDGSDEGWLPRARALDLSTEMLRELAGRVVYEVMGYSR